MNETTNRTSGFWRELNRAFCVLNRIQWQAPWQPQHRKGC